MVCIDCVSRQGRRSVPAELTPRCSVRPSYRLPRPRSRENLYPAGTSHFPRPWAGHVRRNRPPALLTLFHLLDDSMEHNLVIFARLFGLHLFTPVCISSIILENLYQIFTSLFLTPTKRSRSSRRWYIPAAVPPYVHIPALKN